MKKIFKYIPACAFMLTMMASCGDNENFSKEHILTNDELKELARQDSILEAQKNQINADLILEYTANITISSNLYDGTFVEIDTDKIAELFDVSVDDLLNGIAGTGGADVKGFAIEWSTRQDNGKSSTTNSPWGHWWDANGNVTQWGDNAMVFAEFDPESKGFAVGQFPGHLVAGQQIKFIEALRCNDRRAAVVFTVNAVVPGDISASVVSTQKITVETYPKFEDTHFPVQFDLTKALSDLGVESMSDVKFLGVKADGSYNQEASGNGFWYDMDGYAEGFSNSASMYTVYGNSTGYDADYFGIGQYPGNLNVGKSINIKYALFSEKTNKIVMLDIDVNVGEYDDPEQAPAGDPEVMEIDVKLTKPYDTSYSIVTYDMQEALKNAFKMTTYEIQRAVFYDELKIYVSEEKEEEPSYTADVPGYWLNEEGLPCTWGSGSIIWVSLGVSESDLYLYGGNHPGDCSPEGQTVAAKYIITCNGGKVTVNLEYEITAQ